MQLQFTALSVLGTWRAAPSPGSITLLVGSTLLCGMIGVGCATIRGWSRRNRWLALFVGMHLGPIGWLAILIGPRRI